MDVYLINTGWCGGAYGTGQRFQLAHTRAIVDAVLNGHIKDCAMQPFPRFHFLVPQSCPGVPDALFDPRAAWADTAAYDAQLHKLAELFAANNQKFAGLLPQEILGAGPSL